MKPIIKVENLGKQYRLGEARKPYSTFRESLVESFTSPFKKFRKSSEENTFWALKDVSFEIQPGEVVGIIGRNGAGKSTLLKVLSRITEPTKGKVELYGRVASLLEVGTGFHAELTGRENIFLNGAILGMKRAEIAKKFDEIVDFAEIEKFIDTPVKHYSSGMYVRLAFAVASSLEPEILIVDEVLAVGDAQFQKKCLGKIGDVAQGGRTVLLVSHQMGVIRQLCQKTIHFTQGRIQNIGNTDEILSLYLGSAAPNSLAFVKTDSKSNEYAKEQKALEFERISFHNLANVETYIFDRNEPILVKFKIKTNTIPANSSLFFMVLNQDKSPVCAFESNGVSNSMCLKIHSNFLARGNYSIHTFLHIPRQIQFDTVFDEIGFEVNDFDSQFAEHQSYNYGSILGRGEWI